MLLAKLHFKPPTGAHLLLMEHQLCQLHFQQNDPNSSLSSWGPWKCHLCLLFIAASKKGLVASAAMLGMLFCHGCCENTDGRNAKIFSELGHLFFSKMSSELGKGGCCLQCCNVFEQSKTD